MKTIIIIVILILFLLFINNTCNVKTIIKEKFENIAFLDFINKKYNIDLNPMNNLLLKVQTLENGDGEYDKLNVKGPINIDMNIAHPDDGRYDGQIYRADGQTQIAVDDLLRIRDRNNKETGIEFDVRQGVTPSYPNKSMRISRKGIQFGDTNNGRQADSAQISAGTHDANALCIVGMSNENGVNRKIHSWAEGGTFNEGDIILNGNFYFTNNQYHNINTDNDRLNIYGYGGGSFWTNSTNKWTIGWDKDKTVDIRDKVMVDGNDILALLDDLNDNYIKRNSYFDLYYQGADPNNYNDFARMGQDGGGYGTIMREHSRGEALKIAA